MSDDVTPPVLELVSVTKTYQVKQGMFAKPKPLHALNGVSLKLNRKDVLGLVGESGCGKSTLAKILLGLEMPSEGQVLVDGKEITAGERRVLARRIQPVFQDPYSSLNPRKSIEDIIALPLVVHGVGDSASRAQSVTKMLDLVGLPARVRRGYPNQLSGGQRQRVAIARALIMNPEIVICDEPTSALDVSVQSQILNLLGDLRDELGLTYLFISHNLAVVEHLATRVAVMYLGQVVEEAPSQALFANPRHPYTQALLDSVLTPDPSLSVPETYLGAAYPNPISPPSGCRFHPRCAQLKDICRSMPPPHILGPDGHVDCHLYAAATTQ
ncbi:oligopeptide/dipeptide ABC transporter ATP-binding protein-like protein [Nitratireductor indicus C115]|uniref:Oligopeptide/dipeptide ABC transporter ATP-binding protein-like protein n=1 Tax=Nitratireductor indicus C115 TaxID=1231190 RepID=K2N204_9HYPH|nr:oligopeptide/dipeptide ABC transporter ATP-binding protein [Nitratireductor indicus]EKF41493.1 oligopeptide/dipeptide ABC transporter ATP-binding protein-like protein [Nitratireductor indicus C115]SFQ69444.1 peptide/nickel transport system ATP-binding protein [Nitratireductor indicus]